MGMQDANWRELLRFCFARGAYRGAGADLLRSLTRGGGADTGSLFGVAEEQEGAHTAAEAKRSLCLAVMSGQGCKCPSQLCCPQQRHSASKA